MYILTDTPANESLQSGEDLSDLVTAAMAKLRDRLHLTYALRFPTLAGHLRGILDEAALEAWITPFPHLLLPDLVEIKMARLLLPEAAAHDLNSTLALAA